MWKHAFVVVAFVTLPRLAVCATVATAQTFEVNSVGHMVMTTHLTGLPSGSGVGVFGFTVLNNDSVAAAAGPSFRPAPWFGLDLGFGVNHAPAGLGYGPIIIARFEEQRLSQTMILGINLATGKVGFDVGMGLSLIKEIKLGIRLERFGMGPQLEIGIPHTPLGVGGSWNVINLATGDLTPERWTIGVTMRLK